MLEPSILNTVIISLLLCFWFRWQAKLIATVTQTYRRGSIIMSRLVGSMTQLTLHNIPDPTISRIETLPQEVRHEILRYLLSTRYARLSTPKRKSEEDSISHLQCYDWTVGVLRTSKTLYNDGIEILNKENKWIKIIMYLDAETLYMSLANHDVHFIKQQTSAALSSQLAVISISIQRPGFGSTTAQTILLPIEELEALCLYLRAMDIANFFCFKFKFELPNKLPNALQRRILEPFSTVGGEAGRQMIEFDGEVHKAISARVRTAMAQPVGWLRTKGYDVYDIVASMKAVADEAWESKDYSMAVYKYGQAVAFWDAALASHTFLKDLDPHLDNARWHLDTVCSVGQIVATIRSGQVTNNEPGKVSSMKHWIEDPRMHAVPAGLKALMAYATGIHFLVVRQHRQAKQCFQFALTLDAGGQGAMFTRAIVIANGYAASTAAEREADIQALVATLPQSPLSSPAVEPYISDLAAAEKFVCTELGYARKFPDEMTNLIREGISIRLLGPNNKSGKVIGLFPTSGPEALTLTDIDYLEVLLHRRMRAMWRAQPTKRRGREPRLCQVGRVSPDVLLPTLVSRYQNQHARANQVALRQGMVPGRDCPFLKTWVSVDVEDVGFSSVSQDQSRRDMLLASWDARAPAEKEETEKMVDGLVRTHHVG